VLQLVVGHLVQQDQQQLAAREVPLACPLLLVLLLLQLMAHPWGPMVALQQEQQVRLLLPLLCP